MRLGNAMNKVLACLLALLVLAACSTDTGVPQLSPVTPEDLVPDTSVGLTIIDSKNSVGEDRLFDNPPCILYETGFPCPSAPKPGTGDEVSWQGSNQWNSAQYPITVEIDLRRNWHLQDFHYFVGNMPEAATASLNIYVKNNLSEPWRLAGVAAGGTAPGTWNSWRSVDISQAGFEARYAKLEFSAKPNFFNISEVYFTQFGCPDCAPGGGAGLVP